MPPSTSPATSTPSSPTIQKIPSSIAASKPPTPTNKCLPRATASPQLKSKSSSNGSPKEQSGKPTGPIAPSPVLLFPKSQIENCKSQIPSTSSSSLSSNSATSLPLLPPTPKLSSSASTTTSSGSPLLWMNRIVSWPIHQIALTSVSSTHSSPTNISASAGAATGSTKPAT